MNYLPKNRSRNTRYRIALSLAAVFILSATTFYFLSGVIISAASPLWIVENRVTRSLASGVEIFRSRQALLSENTRLKDRLSSLELELSSRPPAQEENNALLELLGRRAESGGIAASVLVRPPQTPYDIILIDAGQNDGVTLGSEVTLAEGPVLGKVSELFPGSAKARLFSSAGEKTNAVLERSGLAITLEGAGGGNFKVVVPRETPVEMGDRILSADIFSRLLAVVEEVEIEQTDSFKRVLARGPVNLFNMRFVIIRP
ncbi:MAG: rod shape-determining protein MreC [bacterium]|nr:rod shape-determining protein MreC [bacterium]